MSDSYLPSYYSPSIGFSYSLGEAAWSTGGDTAMPYLTSYGQLSNGEPPFLPDAMFGQPGALGSTPFLGQHGFNFFPSGRNEQLRFLRTINFSLGNIYKHGRNVT